MIKTSIIVPVYNTAPYLKDCFDSIFNQTQKEIEVIAINDGSTDDSLKILAEIKEKHSEMIIYSQENQGLGVARNKGMDLATGEFVYFIDSDDCLVSDAMETCYYYAKTNDADMIMFDADTFGEIEDTKNAYDRTAVIREQYMVMDGEDFAKKYWLHSFYPSACLIYTSTQFLKKNNFRFEPRIYYEDNVFHTKVIPSAKLIYLPRMLYRRRLRENSITTSEFDQRHAKDYLKMIQLIDQQKHSEDIRNIINERQRKHIASLWQLSVENNLLEDSGFVEELYLTAQRIYGNDVEQINQYQDINVLYNLSNALKCDVVPDEMRERIKKKRNELLENFCEMAPFAMENSCIGIYGTGQKAKELLDGYREARGKIKAKLIFIESNVESGKKKYEGYDVFHINDIEDIRLDCIIITSVKYGQQMRKNIQEQCGDKFKVLILRSNMQLEELGADKNERKQ